MLFRKTIVPAALLIIASAGCATAGDETLAMFKGDPGLSGIYHSPEPASLRGIRFALHTGAPIRCAPAIVGGILYFSSLNGAFYAVDAHTGAAVWTVHLDSNATSSPTVLNGTVFFTTRGEKLYALDARTGATKWTVDLGRDLGPENYWDFYNSSPTPFGTTLYVGSGDGHVRAIDSNSGNVEWSYDAGARVRSTPAVTEDLVVFGTKAGYVMAVDRKTGAFRWKFATDGVNHKFADKQNDTTSVYASPTIAGNVVVIGGRDGQIYGIDLNTGAKKWQTTHDGGSWILSAATENGIVYIASGSAFIVQAANAQTGAEVWRYKTKSAIFGAPTIAGNAVLVEDMSGTLTAIDRTSGKLLWEFRMNDLSLGTPTIADGIVYASSDAGVLYALDTSTQKQQSPEVKRYVYWAGHAPDAGGWFQNDVDVAILNYFKAYEYQQVTAVELQKAMEDQVAHGGRSVVVFADDNIPAEVMATVDRKALIRRYVDNGGNAVFLNDNPLTFVFDPKTGDLQDIQKDRADKVMDVNYPPLNIERGFHISNYTPEATAWGLEGTFVANGGIDPSQVSIVLAKNEFGMATSWVKSYGNKGGGFIQLDVPNRFFADLTPYRLAIDHAVER